MLVLVCLGCASSQYRYLQALPRRAPGPPGDQVDQVDAVGDLNDGLGRSEDWIELVNVGDEPASLAGLRLSDDPENWGQWSLPNVTLDPSTAETRPTFQHRIFVSYINQLCRDISMLPNERKSYEESFFTTSAMPST